MKGVIQKLITSSINTYLEDNNQNLEQTILLIKDIVKNNALDLTNELLIEELCDLLVEEHDYLIDKLYHSYLDAVGHQIPRETDFEMIHESNIVLDIYKTKVESLRIAITDLSEEAVSEKYDIIDMIRMEDFG